MLGKRLKILRSERNLKQVDLANMLGVSRTTYTQYETGKSQPDLETLSNLADFFDVSVDFILGRTDRRNIRELAEELCKQNEKEWTKEELEEIEIFKEFLKFKRDVKKNEQDT